MHWLPKPVRRVRFPSPASVFKLRRDKRLRTIVAQNTFTSGGLGRMLTDYAKSLLLVSALPIDQAVNVAKEAAEIAKRAFYGRIRGQNWLCCDT